MKLTELVATPECQHIYQRYFKIVNNPKPPYQITSKQIYEEIIEYYNADYRHILAILCLDEIDFLKNLETRKNCRKDIPTITSLINKCLLIKDSQNNDYLEIPEELKENVTMAINHVNYEKAFKIDRINEILIGILAVRGIIEPYELAIIYQQYDASLSLDELNDHINTNHFLFQHYFIYQGEEDLLMAYEPYQPIVQEIEKHQAVNTKIDLCYTTNQLQTIAKYGMDISTPVIGQLYSSIEALDNLFFRELLRDSIMLYCQIDGDMYELLHSIKELKIVNLDIFDYLYDCLKAAVPFLHSAAFYGLPPCEYYTIMNENSFFSEHESSSFYNLYLSVLEYTNQIFKITDCSVKQLDRINQEDFSQVRKIFFANKEIVDQYINTNPDHLTSYELSIINDFKMGFIDEFLILENHDTYTLVSNDKKIYAIYGLINHLEEMYPNDILPQVCTLALLPYQHKIVFDGLLEDQPVLLPNNQIQNYQNEEICYELTGDLLN